MSLREQLQTSLGSAYTLDRELGGGGMSHVFLAEERRLGRWVVVKVLSTELAAGLSADRFEREIRVAASLQQANIVPVLNAGDMNGVPYYTMPFVEGESLRARLRDLGALSLSETTSILRDVARALAYAHDRGIVHRDIKPDNVLLSGGAAVVTDFGIAKAISAARAGSESDTLTQLGTAIGTPAYISPEQAAGDPTVDHRADLYSFGCTAYEMLAGQPPFANRAPQRLMAAHMTETPRPVQELRADTSPVLAQLVMRWLEKDARARPQSASEILASLDAMSTSDPSRAAMPAVLLGGPGMFWKALGVYAVGFIAVAVLAQAAIVGIGLPAWVFPGALIVMALGLPVILFTAYTQRVMRQTVTQSPSFTPGGTPSLQTHGTMAALAMKASPHVSWRRTMLGGLWAVAVFVVLVGGFMVLRALGIGPSGSLLAAGRIAAQAPVIITDFATTNADTALGPVVSDAVRAGLAQSKVISLVPPTRVASTMRLMGRPAGTRLDLSLARDVAEREGIHAIVDGSVTGVPARRGAGVAGRATLSCGRR
ncbi:MAG: protein kinase domain-containing protein [Gemmatimonadaceae bacterium]